MASAAPRPRPSAPNDAAGRPSAAKKPAGQARPSATREPGGRARPSAPARDAGAEFRERVGRRYADRNAAVRATLEPLAPGERPAAVVIGAVVAAALGLVNLIAYVAGVKIDGRHPAPGGIIAFSFVMIVCAIGMWRLWYGAVLGFMALLAIVISLFTLLLLLRANDFLGYLIPPIVIGGCGWLFMKLVRALSRIQMPRYPEQ